MKTGQYFDCVNVVFFLFIRWDERKFLIKVIRIEIEKKI